MPMSMEFDEKALRDLASPQRPSEPLRDIVLSMGKSHDIVALETMGRYLLRSCVSARKYKPPIPSGYNLEIDTIVADHRLAKIAERTGLLERLNVDGVATKPGHVAQILCAYVGSSFTQSWKQRGVNDFHNSINDICSMLLDDDDDEPATENNSADKLRSLPGVTQMPQIKPESPSPFPPARGPIPDVYGREDMESVSSGRSPPPLSYGAHYQQPYQSYYPPNPGMTPHPMHMHPQTAPQRFTSFVPGPSHMPGPSYAQPQPPQHFATPPPMAHPQPQVQARGGYPEYPGMSMPANPPGYGVPQPIPPPPPPPVTAQSQGFISLFNELAMKNRMAISWQQHKSGQQHIPEWTMWLMVDGQAKGYGTASTKQAAKEVAAKVALQAMGWLNS
ncbi:hypothetical protein BDV93DRAFT_546418 [Ceratobasidium sp. AG-I]|nr:hypothetical protein BDV93DRAFT_546418 [Ceratobasidium sp. AG-I]